MTHKYSIVYCVYIMCILSDSSLLHLASKLHTNIVMLSDKQIHEQKIFDKVS